MLIAGKEKGDSQRLRLPAVKDYGYRQSKATATVSGSGAAPGSESSGAIATVDQAAEDMARGSSKQEHELNFWSLNYA